MRVVIAAGIFPPDIGGPATYAEQIANALSASGRELSVVCYSSVRSDEAQRPYPVYRIPRNLPKVITYARYWYRLLRLSRTADVIFAQGPTAGGLQSYIINRLFHTPYVVKVTGDYAWEQGTARFGVKTSIDEFQRIGGDLPLIVRTLRSIERAVSSAAARVIVPSEYLRMMVVHWGVPSERVSVVYNAAQSGTSDKRSAADVRTNSSSHPLVLSVGRLVPWKGFDVLVHAWQDVLAKFPSARLVIIGSGPGAERLQELIRSSGVDGSVSLQGQRSRSEIAEWFRQADAFVLNSGYEGLSHSILEAQLCGVPCAVSDVGGNPELVTHEKTGLLFPYNNRPALAASLLRLLDAPQEAKAFAKEAQRHAEGFSVTSMVSKTLSVLEGVSKERSR